MAYAIVQRGFLGIHIAIRKSLVYSILVTLLTVGYFGLIYGIERLFQTKFGYHSIGLSVAAFALMALAFQPLKMGIQRLVDQLLFRVPHEELVKRMERLEREVKQTDKLRAIATLAAGMAHEIKNPLASIKTFAEYLPMRYDDPAFRTKFSKIISQEVDKMNALVHRLLEFAKPATPHLEPVRLSQVVNDTLEFLQGALVQKQITVQVAFAQTDEVLADTVQLKQVFLNVLLNSIEALGGTGQIHIATTQQNGSVHATITDTGSGIAKDDLPRVFEPFYTTKPRGTGLGLSVVHSIVREHGGRIAIESERGQGTTVEISLPLNGGAHGPHAHSHRG